MQIDLQPVYINTNLLNLVENTVQHASPSCGDCKVTKEWEQAFNQLWKTPLNQPTPIPALPGNKLLKAEDLIKRIQEFVKQIHASEEGCFIALSPSYKFCGLKIVFKGGQAGTQNLASLYKHQFCLLHVDPSLNNCIQIIQNSKGDSEIEGVSRDKPFLEGNFKEIVNFSTCCELEKTGEPSFEMTFAKPADTFKELTQSVVQILNTRMAEIKASQAEVKNPFKNFFS